MRVEHFQEFDEFANSVCGVDSRMLMRAPEQASWTIQHLQVGEIKIQLGQLGSGNIAAGTVHEDTYVIYVPLTSGVEYIGSGHNIRLNSCFGLEPGAEFCISTKEKHDWIAAFIPSRLLPDEAIGACNATCRPLAVGSPASTLFSRMITDVMDAATQCEDFESTSASAKAASELQQLASLAVGCDMPSAASAEGRPRLPRERIIGEAMEYLERHPNDHVMVPELASAVSVSERTLRSVFSEFFGVGPTRYLHIRKLNQIHRVLRDADPEHTKVTRVLADHGIWAFGRFAADYRKVYGVSPSVTLRQGDES